MAIVPTDDWAGFFGAQVAGFAALTGLVFVALSINLKVIIGLPGVSGRAAEALLLLVEPVLLGLAGLVAHQSIRALGVEWLSVGILAWLAVTGILVRGRGELKDRPDREIVVRLLGTQGASLFILVAGALLVGGITAGFYWQAAGVAACLVIGIVDAWVLLIEILR